MKITMYYKTRFKNEKTDCSLTTTRDMYLHNQLLPPATRFEETELYLMDPIEAWNFLYEELYGPIDKFDELIFNQLDLTIPQSGIEDHNGIHMYCMDYRIQITTESGKIGSRKGVIEFGRNEKRSGSGLWHYRLRVAECEDPNYPFWSKECIVDHEWKERH